MPRDDILTERTRTRLGRLGAELLRLVVSADDLQEALSDIDALPLESVARVDAEIGDALGHFYPSDAYERADRYREMRETLAKHSELARLVIFHRNGYARQAALDQLGGPAASPLALAAIAYRLNDWVPAVRDAAEACAARVFPVTDPDLMAAVGPALLTRSRDWRRWGRGSSALEEALFRPEVLDRLVDRMIAARGGGMGRVLRAALPHPVLDRHLVRLARAAAHPDIRALAFRCLIEGRADWRTGYRREWTDKVYGLSRRVPVMASRPVERFVPVAALIEEAARDRSALVRRVAADAAVARRADLQNLDAVMALLAEDSSAAVRERIVFIAKEREAEARG